MGHAPCKLCPASQNTHRTASDQVNLAKPIRSPTFLTKPGFYFWQKFRFFYWNILYFLQNFYEKFYIIYPSNSPFSVHLLIICCSNFQFVLWNFMIFFDKCHSFCEKGHFWLKFLFLYFETTRNRFDFVVNSVQSQIYFLENANLWRKSLITL